MAKVGIIRCQQTEDLCGGTADFQFAQKGTGAFEPLGACEVVGFVSCGGCPGKRAVGRAKMLKEHGAEVIVMASCMTLGTPMGFPCPHKDLILDAVRRKLGDEVRVLEYTHPAPKK